VSLKSLFCPFCKTPLLEVRKQAYQHGQSHPALAGKPYILFQVVCVSCGGSGPEMTTAQKAMNRWNGHLKVMS